jgi:CD109 antigen
MQMTNSSNSTEVTLAAGGTATVAYGLRGIGLGIATVSIAAQTPVAVGKADAVQRTLLVEAEGSARTAISNLVLSVDGDSASASGVLESAVPSNIVQGSNKTRLTVIGDIMGPSIAGLERLLTQPFGCGEQNMITLAPNVYVQHYLDATDTLDAATKMRAEANTKQGCVYRSHRRLSRAWLGLERAKRGVDHLG